MTLQCQEIKVDFCQDATQYFNICYQTHRSGYDIFILGHDSII